MELDGRHLHVVFALYSGFLKLGVLYVNQSALAILLDRFLLSNYFRAFYFIYILHFSPITYFKSNLKQIFSVLLRLMPDLECDFGEYRIGHFPAPLYLYSFCRREVRRPQNVGSAHSPSLRHCGHSSK